MEGKAILRIDNMRSIPCAHCCSTKGVKCKILCNLPINQFAGAVTSPHAHDLPHLGLMLVCC